MSIDSNGYYSFPAFTPGLLTIIAISNNGLMKLPFAYKYHTDVCIDTSSASVDISLPSFVVSSIKAVHTDGSPAAGYTILPQSTSSNLCVSKFIKEVGTTPCGPMTWRYIPQAYSNGKTDFALFPRDAATGENFPVFFIVRARESFPRGCCSSVARFRHLSMMVSMPL